MKVSALILFDHSQLNGAANYISPYSKGAADNSAPTPEDLLNRAAPTQEEILICQPLLKWSC